MIHETIEQEKYLTPAEVDARIDHIFDNFNFHRVLTTMLALDWKWARDDNKSMVFRTPTIKEMKEEADKLLRMAINGMKKEGRETYDVSCGGFFATADGRDLSLLFVVEEWDSSCLELESGI